MSQRISDEPVSDSLLQGTIEWASVNSSTRHIASALRELQQSRALVTELRALAERMRAYGPTYKSSIDAHISGELSATKLWLASLSSLLSAHSEAKS